MKGPILVLSTLLLLAGCAPQQESANDQPTVFVSIRPQAGILKALVRDDVEVRTLVGEGQSPHAYEPTARQLAALGGADVLFTVGVPFEQALLKKIRPLYPDLPIVAADARIVKRAVADGHVCTDHAHDHGAPDPHVWLSPEPARIIAENMFAYLQDQGLADAQKYEAYIASLEELQHELETRLAPYKAQRFYVFHPSFGYFADAYGLVQVAIELDGKSPSPRQLADLIEMAQVDGVKVIFVQKQFPVESATAVANAIGGEVVQLDPLAEDVAANLRRIAEAIASSYE